MTKIILLDELTARQQEVLKCLALGWTSSKIGSRLFISRKTVEAHRSTIISKLGADNAAQAVYNACKIGLL